MVTETDPARSATMRAVKSADTGPELLIRSILHRMGYRYRLHGKNLPGKPDIVFAGRRKVVFVHGCFWHGHDCARGSRVPKANRDYWVGKITRNRKRDQEHLAALNEQGWQAVVIWECEMAILEPLEAKLTQFLEPAEAVRRAGA